MFHFLTSLTQKKNYAHGAGFNPHIVVSFFKEISTKKQKLSLWILLDHGFQENKALEGYHFKEEKSVMASKRSSLDGRKSLWKEHMLRATTGIRRSSSKSLTEEITMSTTRSKSSEVEGMGDDGKSTSGGKIDWIYAQISSRGGRKED
jgi:hypothetical protein